MVPLVLLDVEFPVGVEVAKAKRPALDALMAAVSEGELASVVTPKIDRLGRNARHNLDLFERFDAAEVTLYSPDGRDHTDKFIRTVESAIAERERENVSERVKAVTPAKRARGSYNGGPRPYGYEFEEAGGLVPREAEAEIIRRLFRDFNDGQSLRGIARALNSEGVRGPLGGAWSQGRIAERLDMPLYAGFVGGGAQGRHEALIDAATWQRTRDLRQATTQRVGKGADGRVKGGRRSNTHLLGNGLLRCQCGATFYPRKDTRSGRDTYRCRGRDDHATDCNMPPLPRAAVDSAVRQYVAGHVLSPGMAAGEVEREAKAAAKDAASAAEREASKLSAKLDNGRRRMLDDDPPFKPTEWREFKATLEAELTDARARATEAKRIAEAIKRPSGDLLTAVESIRQAAADEATDARSLARQRAAISRIFECFEAVGVPAEDEARPLSATEANLVATQAAELQPFEDTPEFTVKARQREAMRLVLAPIPRPEIAARLGAFPLDSLRELLGKDEMQSVRHGLPVR